MAEGWLFRLRTSLGSQYTAPAWPTVREEVAGPAGSRGLRQPPPERDMEVEPRHDPLPADRQR